MNKFLVLEGIDGSGKDEQQRRLYKHFRDMDIPIFITREPTDSVYGRLIKEIYRNYKDSYDDANSEFLFKLHIQDRWYHQCYLNDVLKHSHILYNRYILSTLTYQGAQGIDEERILKANNDFKKPDLTILLDLPVDIALLRMEKERKSMELFEEKEFLEKVRNNYLKHASLDRKIILLDGTPPIEEVNENLVLILEQQFTSN